MDYHLFIATVIATLIVGVANTFIYVFLPIFIRKPVYFGNVRDYAFALGFTSMTIMLLHSDDPSLRYGFTKTAYAIVIFCTVISYLASLFYRVVYKENTHIVE